MGINSQVIAISLFSIRDANQPHCFSEDRNFNNMTNFWEWLEIANYEGTATMDGDLYNQWGITVSCLLLLLLLYAR